MGLTVAVTGPTGEIGMAAVAALEGASRVEAGGRHGPPPVRAGVARMDEDGYRQGDILDRDSVDALVADADVVVHLAYLIMGSREESRRINLEGTRNVFEATWPPRPTRLVYTSSVAAYGYHGDNPVPLTEDVPARGSRSTTTRSRRPSVRPCCARSPRTDLEVYVLRPCIVAGPKAPALADAMPWRQVTDLLPWPCAAPRARCKASCR